MFRNPKKLEQAWEAQRRERQVFISFFGSDQVVIPGRELSDRMKAFRRYDAYEVRDADGLSDAERIKRSYGMVPSLPEWNFPDDLAEAETVGVIYDEVEGLNFFPDFGLVEETFTRPELAKDDAHREAMLGYLKSTGIIPLPLRRLAERDPGQATRVFQLVLDDPDFVWDRDGEAMLRRYKAEHFERKPRPCITPISTRLAQAQLGLPSPRRELDSGQQTGRNDPCPCGSGKKYKKCCGR